MNLKEICESIKSYNFINAYLRRDNKLVEDNKVLSGFIVFTIRDINGNNIGDFIISDISDDFIAARNSIHKVFDEHDLHYHLANIVTDLEEFDITADSNWVSTYYKDSDTSKPVRELYAQFYYELK